MPWHIESDSADCEGFAVVKDDDGSLAGCHRTEAQAQAQLAALYASESRAVDKPEIVITDIDGTVIVGNRPRTGLIEHLNAGDYPVYVVSGRSADREAQTAAMLRRIGLDFEALFLSPGGDPVAHKRSTAQRLLTRFTVDEAYDDNAQARAAYTELGITAVAPDEYETETDDYEDDLDNVPAAAMRNREVAEMILYQIRGNR